MHIMCPLNLITKISIKLKIFDFIFSLLSQGCDQKHYAIVLKYREAPHQPHERGSQEEWGSCGNIQHMSITPTAFY